ncbi:MAG: family N-acetyltransferase [Chlorobi bacterium]|nr:family N-acetyltransferase [Chlorobiota bacterium]
MTVRSITADEAGLFAIAGGAASTPERIRAIWSAGESRPEWCFIAEEEGRPIGRVGFLTLGTIRHDLLIFGLALPWDGDYPGIGRGLLRDGLAAMMDRGAAMIEHHLPMKTTPNARERAMLLESIGLPLSQRKARFLLEPAVPPAQGRDRLVFRTLRQAGEEEFIAAIAEVTAGTLDTLHRMDVAAAGPAAAAREFYNALVSIDHNPDWWELAYRDDDFVGLIVPQRFTPEKGALNYIGVAPRHRGGGYVDDLLRRGIARLAEHGIERVIADTDVENHPAAAALLRAGFRRGETLGIYRGTISSILDGMDAAL